MKRGELLYEGKAKKIYRTSDPDLAWVVYKDDATAFNGEKKGQIIQKGELNNQISSFLFRYLTKHGIANHWVKMLSPTEQLVRRVQILLLEVVVRYRAAGSLLKRLGMKEGEVLSAPIVEFYYKNDALGDPLINHDHINALNLATPEQVKKMHDTSLIVGKQLQELFLQYNILLVDFKLEFGVDRAGNLLLADEISPDTCRFWDSKTGEKLDKDRFRQDLGNVSEAYREIWQRLEGKQDV